VEGYELLEEERVRQMMRDVVEGLKPDVYPLPVNQTKLVYINNTVRERFRLEEADGIV